MNGQDVDGVEVDRFLALELLVGVARIMQQVVVQRAKIVPAAIVCGLENEIAILFNLSASPVHVLEVCEDLGKACECAHPRRGGWRRQVQVMHAKFVQQSIEVANEVDWTMPAQHERAP